MSGARRFCAAVIRHCLRPLGDVVMALGGIDLYLDERREAALERYRELGYVPPLLPLPYGPPAGHPEQLRPDLPLSRQERDLLAELSAHMAWNATGGRR